MDKKTYYEATLPPATFPEATGFTKNQLLAIRAGELKVKDVTVKETVNSFGEKVREIVWPKKEVFGQREVRRDTMGHLTVEDRV